MVLAPKTPSHSGLEQHLGPEQPTHVSDSTHISDSTHVSDSIHISHPNAQQTSQTGETFGARLPAHHFQALTHL